MDHFSALKAFVAVVDDGGFAKSARRAGVATSSMTRQVNTLERHLGTQLLNRSTRSVTLTDAGESYYEQAVRILEDLDEANRSISEADGPPRGVLRVSLPVVFARLHIAPAVSEFLQACPEIELDLMMTDNVVNLVEERVDLAVRIAGLDSSSLIARKLAPLHLLVCASPDYLSEHGEPKSPSELARHNCLTFTSAIGDRSWRFSGPKGDERIRINGNLRANNSEMLRETVLRGTGIALLPSWLVGRDVEAGRLRAILTGWETTTGSVGSAIHAVYQPNRRGSKKVNAFVDFLAARFGSPPYWDVACDCEMLLERA